MHMNEIKQERIGNYRWTICALLFFATTANYLDRQVLSLLAADLSKQFGWTNTDYANITAAFQFVYALAMLFAGRFIDRIGTKRAYLLAIFVWSGGAILHALALPAGQALVELCQVFGLGIGSASIAGFMLARAVLALGEAGNFPVAIKATAEYFPKKERAFATGIFNSGANVGAILAPLTVPLIAAVWGWEAAFVIIGVLGFAWMVFWQVFYDKPEQQRRLSPPELAHIHSDGVELKAESPKVAWWRLLAYRQTWAFASGKFLTDGVWWFYLFWLPKYLVAQFHIPSTEITLPLAVLYSMTMVGSIGGGYLPTRFINAGATPYAGRMKAMLIIAVFPVTVLLAQPLGSMGMWMPVLLIGVGAAAHQAWSANLFTTVSDMFPKHSVATVVGIGGMAGGLGGVLVSKLGGWLFDYYGTQGHLDTGYMIMFSLCALAYLAAWVIMKTLVPQHKEIKDL